MKKFAFAALAAASLVLGACGGSSNANCKDDASATAYVQKWQTDLTAAITSGKVDPAKAQEAATELSAAMGDMKDVGAVCNKLDDIRKKIGF